MIEHGLIHLSTDKKDGAERMFRYEVDILLRLLTQQEQPPCKHLPVESYNNVQSISTNPTAFRVPQAVHRGSR